MRKMVVGIIVCFGIMQNAHGFYLGSSLTNHTVTVSREVADSVSLFQGKNAFSVPGATEQNLKHLGEYLVRRYQIKEDGKKDPLLVKNALDKNPTEEWKKYATENINEPQLIALTKIVVSVFSDEKSIPTGILQAWTPIIKQGDYGLDHLLGFFPDPNPKESLGVIMWNAYAVEQELPLATELIDSSVVPETSDEALFSRSWKNIWGIDSLEPVYRTQEQLTQGSKKGEVSTISERETQNTPSNVIDLDQDKDTDKTEDKKTSLDRFDSIKRAISQRWSHLSDFKKLAIGGGFSAFALFCLYLTYRR